jgi:hypothetical protein
MRTPASGKRIIVTGLPESQGGRDIYNVVPSFLSPYILVATTLLTLPAARFCGLAAAVVGWGAAGRAL